MLRGIAQPETGRQPLLFAPHFQQVMATDISMKQLEHAVHNARIIYSIGSAEKTLFPDDSFDLITVAQAYHWFHFESFFHEATRVGKADSIVAVWGYGLIHCQTPALNNIIKYFYSETVGRYWDAERTYVDDGYKTIPFYFQNLPSQDFSIDLTWNWEDLVGYFNSWSSVQHFIKANQTNPVDEFASELRKYWIDPQEKKLFSFPLFLKIGKIRK